MILQETYTLANGIAIPKLGLGTWFIDNNKAAQAVRTAAELGYRLIDTAQAYGNERGVGEGIRTCGLKREELFVASKVAAEHKTYEDAARSIDETLEKMGLTYLDQMLIHSPQPWREFRAEKRYFQENRAVWRALEDAQAAGKVRVIGVSNFLRDDAQSLKKAFKEELSILYVGITRAKKNAFFTANTGANKWNHSKTTSCLLNLEGLTLEDYEWENVI